MRIWILGILLVVASAAAGHAADRLALVIGNGGYRSAPALANPVRDASAIADVLKRARFDVVEAKDLDLASMQQRIAAFIERAQKAPPDAVVLVFYAGHALQIDGTNYLLPVEANIAQRSDVFRQAFSLNTVLARLRNVRAATKLVILDACRDNPFLERDTDGLRGLSAIALEGEQHARNRGGNAREAGTGGLLVAFSTSPGAVALDGEGAHSPYAAALVAAIREPGLPIEQMFKRVRLAVHDATGGQQIPWETSSLTTDFTFQDGTKAVVQLARTSGDPATTGSASPHSRRRPGPHAGRAIMAALPSHEAYRRAIEEDDVDAYEGFVAAHPTDSASARVVRLIAERRQEMAWAAVVKDGGRDAFKLYADLYAASPHAAEARSLAQRTPRRVQRIVQRVVSVRNVCLAPRAPRRSAAALAVRQKEPEITGSIATPTSANPLYTLFSQSFRGNGDADAARSEAPSSQSAPAGPSGGTSLGSSTSVAGTSAATAPAPSVSASTSIGLNPDPNPTGGTSSPPSSTSLSPGPIGGASSSISSPIGGASASAPSSIP